MTNRHEDAPEDQALTVRQIAAGLGLIAVLVTLIGGGVGMYVSGRLNEFRAGAPWIEIGNERDYRENTSHQLEYLRAEDLTLRATLKDHIVADSARSDALEVRLRLVETRQIDVMARLANLERRRQGAALDLKSKIEEALK